jgi:mycofactocin precursor
MHRAYDTAGECAMSLPTATPARTADSANDQVPATSAAAEPAPGDEATAPVISQDLLVEEVSIDGMCGVY